MIPLPSAWRTQLAGVSVGKVVKRILKPVVLWALKRVTDDVEQNWQRGQGNTRLEMVEPLEAWPDPPDFKQRDQQ